jgi:hypothetical protein
MSEPIKDPEPPPDEEKRDGIPRWVKIAAAVIGVVATAAGIFTGIFSLMSEYQQQKTAQATELKKAEQERTEQLRIEKQMEKVEIDARAAEKAKEVQIERDKALQQQAALAAGRLELERQSRLEKKEEMNRERERRYQDQKKLFEAVSKVAGTENPYLDPILTIARYAETDTENRGLIIRALTLHAENRCGAGEPKLIFDVFEQVGASALPEAISLNRIALRRLKELLQLHVEAVLKSKVALQVPTLAANEPSVTPFCDAVHSTLQRTENFPGPIQYILLSKTISVDLPEPAERSANADETLTAIQKELSCNAEMLEISAKFLGEHLKTVPEMLELRDNYLTFDHARHSLMDLPGGDALELFFRGVLIWPMGDKVWGRAQEIRSNFKRRCPL